MSEPENRQAKTDHQRLADEVLEEIRAAIARIPKPLESRPRADAYVRSHRTIPREFVETLTFPSLEIARGPFDKETAVDVLQFLEAYRPIRQYLQQITDNLTYTMEKLYSELASDGLLTYNATKRIAKRTGHLGYQLAAKELEKALGRKGRKKKEPEV